MTSYERIGLTLIVVMAGALTILAWMTGACSRPIAPHERGAASCTGSVRECCARACGNLHRLGCPGRQGSPGADDVFGTADDVTCLATCEYAAGQVDIGVDLELDCVAAAQSCEAVAACPEK